MISVIVPIYNVADFLPRCVDSILNQTFSNFELLLIDDGSTDGSSEICDRYCVSDKRCKVVRLANSGVAKARNTGLDMAIGKYIAFVDADDYIHPQYLEILYRTAQNNGCNISVVDFNIIDSYSLSIVNEVVHPFKTTILSQKDLMFRLFSETLFMVVWGKLYDRKLLEKYRFKNLNIAEDVEFNTHVYKFAERAVYADIHLYYWVNRTSSMTRSTFSQRNIDAVDSYVLALNSIPKSDSLYRAYALLRLYKVILYTRYNAPAAFMVAVKSKMKLIVKQTHLEFMHNYHIPIVQRCSLSLFYYIPVLYRIFRWWFDRRKL